MRTLRIAEPPSAVGADLRATLFSLGRDESACRGVALVGCHPQGGAGPVDAVVITPTGIVVVAGVDLHAPSLHLYAPLRAGWLSDGWRLEGPDGLPNPAVPALRAAAGVRRLLTAVTGREDVRTVLAVGPFVERVEQPPEEARDDVRVLYPTPPAVLPALHQLTDGHAALPAALAAELLAILAPTGPLPEPGAMGEMLAAECFDRDATGPAALRTGHHLADAPTTALTPVPATTGRRGRGGRLARWYSLGAFGVGALVFVVLVVVLVTTSGAAGGRPAAPRSAVRTVTVDGHAFRLRATGRDTGCSRHAFGDVRQALRDAGCRGLTRRAYTTTLGGRGAAVAVADLTFRQASEARAFKRALDVPGSGGITALSSDGTPWHGAPESFAGAAYASSAHAARVRVTAAVWLAGTSQPTDSALAQLATQALRLPQAG